MLKEGSNLKTLESSVIRNRLLTPLSAFGFLSLDRKDRHQEGENDGQGRDE